MDSLSTRNPMVGRFIEFLNKSPQLTSLPSNFAVGQSSLLGAKVQPRRRQIKGLLQRKQSKRASSLYHNHVHLICRRERIHLVEADNHLYVATKEMRQSVEKAKKKLSRILKDEGLKVTDEAYETKNQSEMPKVMIMSSIYLYLWKFSKVVAII